MRAGQRQAEINVFTPIGNDWALRSVGDVDGDGTADIVWQHISGQVHYWPMRAGQRQGGINIFTPIGNDWVLRLAWATSMVLYPSSAIAFRFAASTLPEPDERRDATGSRPMLQPSCNQRWPRRLACAAGLVRDGDVTVFTEGDGSIDSAQASSTRYRLARTSR